MRNLEPRNFFLKAWMFCTSEKFPLYGSQPIVCTRIKDLRIPRDPLWCNYTLCCIVTSFILLCVYLGRDWSETSPQRLSSRYCSSLTPHLKLKMKVRYVDIIMIRHIKWNPDFPDYYNTIYNQAKFWTRNWKMRLRRVILWRVVQGPSPDSTPDQGMPALETQC